MALLSTFYVPGILCYKLHIAYFMYSVSEACKVDIILIFTKKGSKAQRLRS